MKQLLKLSKITLLCLFTVFITTLSGCKEDTTTNPLNIEKKESLFERFKEEDSFWTEKQVENLVFDSPEKALVPLLFKSNGDLYSTEEYGELLPLLLKGEKELESYFTDLQTYKKVLGSKLKTSKNLSDYAIPISESNYIYDPYRSEPVTREEYLKLLNFKDYSSAKIMGTSFNNGDIIVGSLSVGNPLGHCATVHEAAQGSFSSIIEEIKKTKTFDAWGNDVPFSEQVGIKNMSNYWLNKYCNSRSRMRTKTPLAQWQVNLIKSFSASQDSKGYATNSTLWSNNTWYCSKLVYRAYYHAGIDLLPGTRYFIIPTEIKYSSKLYGMSF